MMLDPALFGSGLAGLGFCLSNDYRSVALILT